MRGPHVRAFWESGSPVEPNIATFCKIRGDVGLRGPETTDFSPSFMTFLSIWVRPRGDLDTDLDFDLLVTMTTLEKSESVVGVS